MFQLSTCDIILEQEGVFGGSNYTILRDINFVPHTFELVCHSFCYIKFKDK